MDLQVLVVGGGLAGVTACLTVVENGCKPTLIEKRPLDQLWASAQEAPTGGIEDNGDAVAWLLHLGVEFPLVYRMGGHSAPRTLQGMVQSSLALLDMLWKISKKNKARIVDNAADIVLLQDSNNTVVGLKFKREDSQFEEHGPVILCTGGFGADFGNDSWLAKYCPNLMTLPTAHGEHCIGDGIKMGEAIGAKTIDLEWVQVHPTGLVKPCDVGAKNKMVAAEALRGVGGIILDANGKRFANELGEPDYVVNEMHKNTPPFRLCLNKAASNEIMPLLKQYCDQGAMQKMKGVRLAKVMGINVSVLEKTHQDHYDASKKMEENPEGGSWPAYPSGKSWDEVSGKTGSGKKFYRNVIDGAAVKTELFHVAIITPVISDCMGGIEITSDGSVIGKTGRIDGLYCAGEIAGGVHGNLGCVVFGRSTGLAATKLILGNDVKKVDLKELERGKKKGTWVCWQCGVSGSPLTLFLRSSRLNAKGKRVKAGKIQLCDVCKEASEKAKADRKIKKTVTEIPEADAEEEEGGGGVPGKMYKVPSLEKILDMVKSTALDLMDQESLEDDAALMEAGLDSLAALKFGRSLAKQFPCVTIPSTMMFDMPTTKMISEHIAADLKTKMTVKEIPEGDEEEEDEGEDASSEDSGEQDQDQEGSGEEDSGKEEPLAKKFKDDNNNGGKDSGEEDSGKGEPLAKKFKDDNSNGGKESQTSESSKAFAGKTGSAGGLLKGLTAPLRLFHKR